MKLPPSVSLGPLSWLLLLLLPAPGLSAVVPAAGAAQAAPAPGAVAVPLVRRAAGRPSSKPRAAQTSEYYGQVSVGSPGQTFLVVFDTGSGNLLLPSTDCGDSACRDHQRFNSRLSSTARQVAYAEKPTEAVVEGGDRDIVTITFGTGEMTGVYVRDRVCLGLGPGARCCDSDFVAATEESDEPFGMVSFDGILGLGLPELAEGPEFSILDRLSASGAIRRPVFGVFLGRGDEDGEIIFGGYNASRVASRLVWAPVTQPGYWQVRMEDVRVAGRSLGLCDDAAGGCKVAVDTGTSLLAAPSDVVRSLSESLRVGRDCANIDELPELGFLVGRRWLTLGPDDYVSQTNGACALGLMALDIPPPKGPLFIFGDPFLRKYYTVYDRERMRVGFALARHGSSARTAAAPRQRLRGVSAGAGQ